MRTNKELLELLLKQLKTKGVVTGLCATINHLFYNKQLINIDENEKLHFLIKSNFDLAGVLKMFRFRYWWEMGEV